MFVGRRQPIDDAGLERLFRGEEAPGQRDLVTERGGGAILKQRPIARSAEPARRFGQLETGTLGGDDQVAFQRQAQTEPQHITVHRGDDRLPIDGVGEQIGRVGAPTLGPAELFELLAAAQLALTHIGAAAERAAAAVQDRDFGFGVEIEAAEGFGELADHFVADRVELIRAVEGDGRDLVGAGVFDEILFVRIHHSLPRAASMGLG